MASQLADQSAERVSIDDLALEKLPRRLLNTVEETKVKRAFGLHFVVEGGIVSIELEANVSVARMVAFLTTAATIIWIILNFLFPALQPILDKIAIGA